MVVLVTAAKRSCVSMFVLEGIFVQTKKQLKGLKPTYSMFKVSIKFYCNVAIKNNKKQDSNEYSIRTLWTCSVNSKHCSLYSKLLYWYNWVKMKIDHVDVWHHLNSVGDQHYPRNITIPINTELILSSFMRFQHSGQGIGHLNTRLWSVNVPARLESTQGKGRREANLRLGMSVPIRPLCQEVCAR